MAGHSRSKNGVASLAYVPAIHVFGHTKEKDVDARHSPGMTVGIFEMSVMAGLVPAIHVFTLPFMAKGGFVYFMTNRRDGTLYVGVTSNLPARAYQHREGLVEGFTKRYELKLLVYYEQFDDIRAAIQREKAIKHWPRVWKVRLIHQMNPEWRDLSPSLTP